MKRIAIAAITLVLVATACSAAEDASPDPEAVAAPETTTLATTATTLSSTTTTAPGQTSNADQEAISIAYEVVFSSETTYEEKTPYLEDPSGLEDTVLKYQETGETMGGVSLAATKITVNGTVAEVIYDFLFAGTPTYPDQVGDAVLIGETWMITRDMFCSIMASARVGCPSP
jgi:hypothetical protein